MSELKDDYTARFLNVPYAQHADFVQRDHLSHRVQEAIEKAQPIVLFGQTGSGKTYYAVRVAYDFLKQNAPHGGFVLWIDAATAHSVLTSFFTAALELDFSIAHDDGGNICEMTMDWIGEQFQKHNAAAEARSKRRCLIVIDGIESNELWNQPLQLPQNMQEYSPQAHSYQSLQHYLSHVASSELIVTTTSAELAKSFCEEAIEVGDLTEAESRTLCVRILDPKNSPHAGNNIEDADYVAPRICSVLGRNAQVITLAAAFLQSSNMRIAEYLRLAERYRLDVRKADTPAKYVHVRGGNKNIYHDPASLDLVILIIMENMFREMAHNDESDLNKRQDEYVLFSIAALVRGLRVPIWTFKQYECDTIDDEMPALKNLMQRRLFMRVKPGVATVPSPVLKFFFATPSVGMEKERAETACNFVRQILQRNLKQNDKLALEVIPMTEVMFIYPELPTDAKLKLLSARIAFNLRFSLLTEAWKDAQTAFRIAQMSTGKNLLTASETLRWLGGVAANAGKDDLAEQIWRVLLASIENLEGEEGLELHQECLRLLGTTLISKEQFTEAEVALQSAIELGGRIWAIDDPRTLQATNEMIRVLAHRGKFEEARRLQDQTLPKLENILADDNPILWSALANKAMLLEIDDQWEGALLIRRHLLAAKEKAGINDCYGTPSAKRFVARALYHVDAKEEAYLLLKEVLDDLDSKVGRDHPEAKAARETHKRLFHDQLVTV